MDSRISYSLYRAFASTIIIMTLTTLKILSFSNDLNINLGFTRTLTKKTRTI